MSGTQAIPLIVGHRGAAALEPENTLTSFARGIADGADVIELDVHLSRDGRVVVHHDPAVDRTAVPGEGRTTGAIKDLTWDELQEVELRGGQRILGISEALDAITVPILLEIKAVEAARPVAEIVLATGAVDRVTMISFKAEALRVVREVSDAFRRGFIVQQSTESSRALLAELGAETYSVSIEHLSKDEVDVWHDKGISIGCWTALIEADVRRAIDAGVDAITADDPAWCRAVVEASRRARLAEHA